MNMLEKNAPSFGGKPSNPDEGRVKAVKEMLKQATIFVTVTGSDDDGKEALDIDGDPKPDEQQMAREVNLMNEMFPMSQEAALFGYPAVLEDMHPAYKEIHESALHCLMQIIADSRRNEMYFAKQFTPSKSGGTQGWVDAVIEQVGDRLFGPGEVRVQKRLRVGISRQAPHLAPEDAV